MINRAQQPLFGYIENLERENERLYSHHSSCKDELGDLVERANKWKMRAQVAEGLAQYFNSIYMPGSPFMLPEDLTKEINMQTERLLRLVREGKEVVNDPVLARVLKHQSVVAKNGTALNTKS